MNNFRNKFSAYAVAFVFALSLAGVGAAQNRNDRDIRDAVRSLNSKIEDFETNLRYQMQSSSANSRDLAAVTDDIRSLRLSVSQFQDFYDAKRENRDDVNAIVAAAKRVDDFVRRFPQNRRVEDDWTGAKRQIDRLATNYGVRPNWIDRGTVGVNTNVDYGSGTDSGMRTTSVGLSGTYDLDAGRSDNVDEIVAEVRVNDARRAELKDKLAAPEQIALDIRGNQITLATTNASPVTFVADGREKSEQIDGRNVRLRAVLMGDKLTVTTLGGETDYTLTFTSADGGKTLKVSRRITTDYLKQTVFADSLYSKTDSVARLGIKVDDTTGTYSDNDNSGTVANGGVNTGIRTGAPTAVTSRPGNYTVPNGVTIIAILDNEINTKVSQNNDRFRMTVQAPDEFRGATIEGYVTGLTRSGTVSGDPKITFNFEKITLRSGETYDFAGNLQSVQAINGKNVTVDNEGTVKGESQTRQTAKRGGIGAGVGAVIGAIAGGAKGAAIGAIIGAGGGAGTVAIQGKGDIQLQVGSTITVVSSSPMSR
jgi:hypothetical protein